jgi:hypothetical protein
MFTIEDSTSGGFNLKKAIFNPILKAKKGRNLMTDYYCFQH